MPELDHPYPQLRSRSPKKAGALLLLSGLLALLAEATVMAALARSDYVRKNVKVGVENHLWKDATKLYALWCE